MKKYILNIEKIKNNLVNRVGVTYPAKYCEENPLVKNCADPFRMWLTVTGLTKFIAISDNNLFIFSDTGELTDENMNMVVTLKNKFIELLNDYTKCSILSFKTSNDITININKDTIGYIYRVTIIHNGISDNLYLFKAVLTSGENNSNIILPFTFHSNEFEIFERTNYKYLDLTKKVPDGPCDNIGMEVIRALNRINYRATNDGDTPFLNRKNNYGLETSNPSFYFIKVVLDHYDHEKSNNILCDLKSIHNDKNNEFIGSLLDWSQEVVDMLNEHPDVFEEENHWDSRHFPDFEGLIENWDNDEYYRYREAVEAAEAMKRNQKLCDRDPVVFYDYETTFTAREKFNNELFDEILITDYNENSGYLDCEVYINDNYYEIEFKDLDHIVEVMDFYKEMSNPCFYEYSDLSHPSDELVKYNESHVVQIPSNRDKFDKIRKTILDNSNVNCIKIDTKLKINDYEEPVKMILTDEFAIWGY